jgi:hypothetical protein
MDAPLLLYSAGTWLAYAIAERFYGGVHYVWCSPFYDGSTAALHINVPPSSSPAEIYHVWQEEARRGDLHSSTMERNRNGVMHGAGAKLQAGEITQERYDEIEQIVADAKAPDFRPVLYVIPFERVRELVREVPVPERAHPMSLEYRIAGLPRGTFHAIELRG